VCVRVRACVTVYLSLCARGPQYYSNKKIYLYHVEVGCDEEEYALERYMQDEALDRHAWTGNKFS
jgi:hypothetical protein